MAFVYIVLCLSFGSKIAGVVAALWENKADFAFVRAMIAVVYAWCIYIVGDYV